MATLTFDCPHCGTNNVSFDILTAVQMRANWVSTLRCGSCAGPVMAEYIDLRLGGHAPMNYSSNIRDLVSLVGYWPSRSNAIAPPHTPEKVARRFVEAEKAYESGLWNAAVTTYRSVLDIATKSMPDVPENGNLFTRLEWLESHGRITPAMKDWATHVRLEGNAAVHEDDEFSEDDARPLRLFTETFLRYSYELPGEVQAFRAQTPGDIG